MVKNIFFKLLFIILIFSCKEKKQNEKNNIRENIVQKGFIIKTVVKRTGESNWFFVAAEEFDKKEWLNYFSTKNLKDGFSFHPMGHHNFPVSFIEKHLDTISLENHTEEQFYIYQLRLFPVKIEYTLNPKFQNLKPKSKFVQKIGKRKVEFYFNSLPVNILNVIPLVEVKRPIIECKCEQRENDENNYLFKICTYLKEKESKYSDTPCSYGIRKIENDTLNGKKVIKVNLDCCYLGDEAYFDPETKEIVKFSYGAM